MYAKQKQQSLLYAESKQVKDIESRYKRRVKTPNAMKPPPCVIQIKRTHPIYSRLCLENTSFLFMYPGYHSDG